MERTKIFSAISFALLLFLASPASAQVDIGNFTINGAVEGGPLVGKQTGKDARFEEYRDITTNTGIITQLQLMIGSKKEDFYLNFDSGKLGFDDQNYRLRFGRWGLLDLEFEWDQFPHLFSQDTARTPYARDGGGGTFTLATKPASTAGTDVRDWVNTNAHDVDLKLFNGIGRFKLRYTPSPQWTFTGTYWSNDNSGKRAFGALFGLSPGNFNITELTEPISYQTHNIELGGEYTGNGWTIGLKYNGSLFHNNVSTVVWDNPLNLTGLGAACTNSATYSNAAGTGTCRGRLDLYPSNQAHTFSLTGTAVLPMKSHFLGTVSYGWRLQDDSFLPFTINSALTSPPISRNSLDGDVRPLMVNATLVNRYFDRVNLKAYYRLYDLNNRSKKVDFPDGRVELDSTVNTEPVRSFPYAYSKQNIGLEGGYDFTRWLSGKLAYGWERMHRDRREVLNSDEHSLGPTFDIKPTPWVLFRASYKHFWRNAPNYDAGRETITEPDATPDELREEHLEALRKFDEAARHRDKSSLFAQFTPWEQLTLYTGFEITSDRYPNSEIGTQNDFNYSPSIGFVYAPLDWVKLFADYNWERFDWKLRAIQRNSDTQTPENNPLGIWLSRGRDRIHTFSIGSDLDVIRNLLRFRIQYGFSDGLSRVRASGSTCSFCTRATDYPDIRNQWHELLARFEYELHKNVGLGFGYYFNHATEKDVGVDIMKPWMGDVDTGVNVQRSIFLGDRIKGPFTAHVGFVTLKFKF